MKRYGLIGYPLSHSFSKKYFTGKFENEKIEDHVYELFPIKSIKKFNGLLNEHPDLCGLNVTIPYKIEVMYYLDWINDDARAVGAVNCIRVTSESPISAAFSGELGFEGHNFKLEGYNTDIYGFEMSLKPLLHGSHKNALILGDGGAAQAVKYILDKLQINYLTVARKPLPGAILFADLTKELMNENTLIINTTPVGTHPNVDECPAIPYEYITNHHLLYDLIYNPEQTLFLKKGAGQGAIIKNGHEMLVLQAERSWEIWNSKTKFP